MRQLIHDTRLFRCDAVKHLLPESEVQKTSEVQAECGGCSGTRHELSCISLDSANFPPPLKSQLCDVLSLP